MWFPHFLADMYKTFLLSLSSDFFAQIAKPNPFRKFCVPMRCFSASFSSHFLLGDLAQTLQLGAREGKEEWSPHHSHQPEYNSNPILHHSLTPHTPLTPFSILNKYAKPKKWSPHPPSSSTRIQLQPPSFFYSDFISHQKGHNSHIPVHTSPSIQTTNLESIIKTPLHLSLLTFSHKDDD